MTGDRLQLSATYFIAVMVLAGSFALIWANRGDAGQAWLAVGAILGYVFRDSGGASATRSAIQVANSQPTVTTTAGPPATTTVTPTDPTVPVVPGA